MNILAIETSCDETSIAFLTKEKATLTVKSNVISSQVDLHRKWGGVVPNLAGREHAKNIMPVLTEALDQATVIPADIDLITVTSGPGLIPALLIGVSVAKTLAYSWRKPLIGIHHIEGHIYANWIVQDSHRSTIHPAPRCGISESQGETDTNEQDTQTPVPQFPALCLIVSGGHTQLVLMRDHCTYDIIGQTQDDAVGEAYDKVARLMGLSYPGGPEIAKQAEIFKQKNLPKRTSDVAQNETSARRQRDLTQGVCHNTPSEDRSSQQRSASFSVELPRPMLHSGNYNFSFSGIKTAVLYAVREMQKMLISKECPDKTSISKEEYNAVVLPQAFVQEVAHEFQEAVTEVLVTKTLQAAQEHGVKSVLIAGGVSANTRLREALGRELTEHLPHVTYHIPDMSYCLDNAAMIGAAAAYRYEHMSAAQKEATKKGWYTTFANPSMKMTSL